MNKESYGKKIKLNTFDDLFGMNDPIKGAATEIKEIPLEDLYTFEGHPFRVVDDEKMEELVASVKENGVLVPGICRMRSKGGYEIISGHRRKRACELAGVKKIPMFVKNLSDDDAAVAMVDANLQRENILPSEKAKAYQIRYEAIKHPGVKGNSLDRLMEFTGESRKQIQRYIQLARLSDDLLNMVDEKKLQFTVGVNLSLLLVREQKWVYEVINREQIKVSIRQSEQLKTMSRIGELDEAAVDMILNKSVVTASKRKVQIEYETIQEFFDDSYDDNAIKDVIIRLLTEWKKQ